MMMLVRVHRYKVKSCTTICSGKPFSLLHGNNQRENNAIQNCCLLAFCISASYQVKEFREQKRNIALLLKLHTITM